MRAVVVERHALVIEEEAGTAQVTLDGGDAGEEAGTAQITLDVCVLTLHY